MTPAAPLAAGAACSGRPGTLRACRPGTLRACHPGALRARVGMLLNAILMLLLLAPCHEPRAAEDAATLEQRVKAAYLYRFSDYVDWPESAFAGARGPLTMAVIGAEPVAAELDRIAAGRSANDRAIAVRRLKAGEPLVGVNVLFIGADAEESISQVAQSARAHAILTVTESAQGLTQGSIINFVIAENRVRFEVSLDAAEKSNLRLSSRLLAVAQQVRPGAR